MISIIICSKYPDISQELKENIKNTIGTDYEIVVINNSQNQYSIFSAYNEGISQSKFPFLCFVHEDVMFKTKNWGKILFKHLSDNKTGIIGVAGGKIMTRIPASWWLVGPGYKNLIQHYKNKKTVVSEKTEHQSSMRQSAIILDGVFLAFRAELLEKIKFDEELTGFHGYDHDISVQTVMAGYNNYVIFDLLLEHFSEGNMNAQYYTNLIKVYKKWKDSLPLFTSDITFEIKAEIENIEIRMLEKLIRRMARSGSSTNEIVSETRYFANNIKIKGVCVEIKFLKLKIFLTRLFNAPKYLLR
jgi:hypothetical protein